jgi:hypothetical protein
MLHRGHGPQFRQMLSPTPEHGIAICICVYMHIERMRLHLGGIPACMPEYAEMLCENGESCMPYCMRAWTLCCRYGPKFRQLLSEMKYTDDDDQDQIRPSTALQSVYVFKQLQAYQPPLFRCSDVMFFVQTSASASARRQRKVAATGKVSPARNSAVCRMNEQCMSNAV